MKAYTDSQSISDLSTLTHSERISIRNILAKLSPADIQSHTDITFLKGK